MKTIHFRDATVVWDSPFREMSRGNASTLVGKGLTLS